MRIVGDKDRSEIEFDPTEAYRRGVLLDRAMRAVLLPTAHGVTRGTHAEFNRIDELRRVAIARILNST